MSCDLPGISYICAERCFRLPMDRRLLSGWGEARSKEEGASCRRPARRGGRRKFWWSDVVRRIAAVSFSFSKGFSGERFQVPVAFPEAQIQGDPDLV